MNQRHSGLALAGLAALLTVTMLLVYLAVQHGATTVTNSVAAPTLSTAPSTSGASSSTAAAPSGLAIVGGGMTYANSTSADKPGSRSWLSYFTLTANKKVFVGDGLTTTAATKLMTGGPFEGLLISTADDDAAAGKSAEQSVSDTAALVTKTKTASDAVLVIPLSPSTTFGGAKIRAFNDDLQTAVKAKGWIYCDAWAPVRGNDGQWADEADSALNGRGVSSEGAKKVAAGVQECVAGKQPSAANATATS